MAEAQAASVGQVFAVRQHIRDGDPLSWVDAFTKQAKQLQADAQERADKKHRVSAATSWLCASAAWRAGEYYARLTSPGHRQMGLASADSFQKGIEARGYHCESHYLQWCEQRLPYYIVSNRLLSEKKKPVLIVVSGFDGTREEECLLRGLAGLERGYDLVLFSGPGQMDTWRYNDSSAFIPNYEEAFNALLTELFLHRNMSGRALVLYGVSLGGYFALRAASYTDKLSALICNSPIHNLYDYLASFCGFSPLDDTPQEENFTIDEIWAIPDKALSAERKVQTESLILRYGAKDFIGAFRNIKAFEVTAPMLKRISCPVLCMVGEAEGAAPLEQAHYVHELCGGKLRVFKNEEGAADHCQLGNVALANAEVFDWLDEKIA